ncbi:MAG: PIN domain-containing protein [Candidatus Eisenbacteria bacterium]|nr:PIN domain-containing protein [Candidatus Eisenbacteria bacterium]MCC7141987.1 PIN domain-containing protein [Candidatus Eisenbacteria bacterium]
MIAVDTNILVYADRSSTPHHARAVAMLRTLAEGTTPWAIPIFCLGEFLRVVTHPRVFSPPTPPEEALRALENLFRSPSLRLLYPGPGYWAIFQQYVRDGHATGNLVFDAQIAAVCVERGADTLLTEDRDFLRFRGIQIRSLSGPEETR